MVLDRSRSLRLSQPGRSAGLSAEAERRGALHRYRARAVRKRNHARGAPHARDAEAAVEGVCPFAGETTNVEAELRARGHAGARGGLSLS